jgi:hypothetical protein
MSRLVSPQSFPHLWKKLWKIRRSASSTGHRAGNLAVSGEAKASKADSAELVRGPALRGGVKPQPPEGEAF